MKAAPAARAVAAFAVAVVLLTARGAAAGADIVVSLDYASDPALGDCPSREEFAKAVVRQLRRDPFRADAPRHAVVRLSPLGARIVGRVEWRDASGEWEGERTFSSRNESCLQLARAMALATAIQIDLLARVEGAETGKPAADAEPLPPILVETRPAAAPVPPAPSAPREPSLAVDVGVGVLQDLGDAPALIVPRVAVTVGRPSTFGLRLALGGLGPGADVTRPAGVAELDRIVMTVDVVRFFRPGRRLQPLLALGAGWQDVRASGLSATPTLVTHETQAFTALVTASGGLAVAFGGRFAAIIEVEALLFRPAISVQVGSSEAAHLEGATLFAHGGLLARF